MVEDVDGEVIVGGVKFIFFCLNEGFDFWVVLYEFKMILMFIVFLVVIMIVFDNVGILMFDWEVR